MQALSIHSTTVAVLSSWIAISACLTIFNAALLHDFRHPVLLTCWHQFVSVVLILILRLARPSLLYTGDDEKGIPPLTVRSAMQLAWPVAICQSIGLVCGNTAIMYLSVAFCQMIKSFTPGCVYICGCFLGTQEWSAPKLTCLAVITLGLALTGFGELHFSWLGFCMQVAALVTEGLRLNLLELRMKSAGYKLTALSSVQVFAPMVCLFLFVCALFVDRSAFDLEQIDAVGKGVLLSNAGVAFLLNVVIYLAIQCASGLTYALAGVVKDVLIVIGGCYFQGSPISATQIVGYAIALVGLQLYGHISKSPSEFQSGFLSGLYRSLRCWSEEKVPLEECSSGDHSSADERLLVSPSRWELEAARTAEASKSGEGGTPSTSTRDGNEDDLEASSQRS
jgi:hypothetical protein